MIANRIRAMGSVQWIALFALILAAWGALYAMALPADLRAASRLYGADFLGSLCNVAPGAAGWPVLFAMWALMAGAMMAPTALPAFATYEDLGHAGARARLAPLVAGYLAVWLGFAAAAAGAQVALAGAGLVDALGQSRSALFSGALLIGAGAYQFSAVKAACLARCRHPLTFFMAHWDEGPWRNGLRLGLVCLGCCWALMTLAFVGGTMNLAFMGLATVLMALEKLSRLGRFVSAPLGVILILAGLGLAASTII
jgi:predicted metal-binding membrane protein